MEVTVSISISRSLHIFRKSLNLSKIYSWNSFGLWPFLLEAFGGVKDYSQLVFPVHFKMLCSVSLLGMSQGLSGPEIRV